MKDYDGKIKSNLAYVGCAILGLLNFILLAIPYISSYYSYDLGEWGGKQRGSDGISGYKVMDLWEGGFSGVMSSLVQLFVLWASDGGTRFSRGLRARSSSVANVHRKFALHRFPFEPLALVRKKRIHLMGVPVFTWSKRRDSNPRSPVPETGAIPPSLRLEIVNTSFFATRILYHNESLLSILFCKIIKKK